MKNIHFSGGMPLLLSSCSQDVANAFSPHGVATLWMPSHGALHLRAAPSPLHDTNAAQDNMICHVTVMLLSISRTTPLPMHVRQTLFTCFALMSCAPRRNRRFRRVPKLQPSPTLRCPPSSAAPPPRYSFPSNLGILAALQNAARSSRGDCLVAFAKCSSCRSLTSLPLSLPLSLSLSLSLSVPEQRKPRPPLSRFSRLVIPTAARCCVPPASARARLFTARALLFTRRLLEIYPSWRYASTLDLAALQYRSRSRFAVLFLHVQQH